MRLRVSVLAFVLGVLPGLHAGCEPQTAVGNPPVPSSSSTSSSLTSTSLVTTTSSPPKTAPRDTRTPVPSTTLPIVPGLLPAPTWASWPSWRVTADGVPYYSGRPACTVEQAHVVALEFALRGASTATQQWAVYVASREGGCRFDAVNLNTRTKDQSYCAFQLNAIAGGPLSAQGLLGKMGWTPAMVIANLQQCAQAAAEMWAVCGKGPWIHGDYGCRKPTS